MGMCKPSGGISNQTGRVGSLPRIWLPNTRIDLYDEKEICCNKDGMDQMAELFGIVTGHMVEDIMIGHTTTMLIGIIPKTLDHFI